jgi:hypothetical protein
MLSTGVSLIPLVREILLHGILGIAAIVYGIKSPEFEHRFWEVVVPLVWLVCIEVIVHIVKAAWLLGKESFGGPIRSAIVSASGNPFEFPAERMAFYRTRVWGLASLVVVGCIVIGALVRVVAGYASVQPPPPPAPVAIFADCQFTNLPISPFSLTHKHHYTYLRLIKNLCSHNIGDSPIFQIALTSSSSGHPKKRWTWRPRSVRPDPHYGNPGAFGYKCDVSNHSQVDVLDVAVRMTFCMETKSKTTIRNTRRFLAH